VAIESRLWKKLQGKKGWLFLKVRKEVLVKSVAQAVPIYLMSFSKLH